MVLCPSAASAFVEKLHPHWLYVLVVPSWLYSVNGLHANQPSFCFLSRMVVGSIVDLLEVGVPRCFASPFGRPEFGTIKPSISSGLPEVGVPFLVLLDAWQLCWSSGHQYGLLEVGVLF